MSGPIMPSASGKAWLLGRQTVGEDASDCSSQDFHSLSVYQLPVPSKLVVTQLSTSSHGQQLLEIVRTLGSQLLAQSVLCPSAAAARSLLDNLQELHSCIVALDDMIDEQRISSGVATQLDECRLWLRATQGFVLTLQKQAQGFADEGQPSTSSMEAGGYSLQEAGCSTSTAPTSAASLAAWRSMCQEASDALGCVAESMSTGGAEEGQAGGKRTRLVAQSSRLSYATHWSKKVAI